VIEFTKEEIIAIATAFDNMPEGAALVGTGEDGQAVLSFWREAPEVISVVEKLEREIQRLEKE
jgi:hypothetical protein